MAAVIVEIADAVVAALNGASLSQTFTAERAYVVSRDIKDLETLKVDVVPVGLTNSILTRSSRLYEYRIDIGIRKRASTVPECDALMLFVEQISDLFVTSAVGAYGAARNVAVANDPIYSPEHLDGQRVFISVVTLTFNQQRT